LSRDSSRAAFRKIDADRTRISGQRWRATCKETAQNRREVPSSRNYTFGAPSFSPYQPAAPISA
jgi:hypothetical protein